LVTVLFLWLRREAGIAQAGGRGRAAHTAGHPCRTDVRIAIFRSSRSPVLAIIRVSAAPTPEGRDPPCPIRSPSWTMTATS
jgi:hypothetical protein